ncbi:MAG: hypothetical protein FWC80_03350 [Firmicutes bacterium]|nr:hypothetical protein [Bacillota bacterium]
MQLAFDRWLMNLLIPLLALVDFTFDIFRLVAGMETTTDADGNQQSLVDMFLGANMVQRVFVTIFIFSLLVVAISITCSVIKNTVSDKDRKSHAKTVGQGIGAILTTAVISLVMLTGIQVSNLALTFLDQQFAEVHEQEQTMSLGERIFDLAVESGYVWYVEICPDTDEVLDIRKVTDMDGNPISQSGWRTGDACRERFMAMGWDERTVDAVLGGYRTWPGGIPRGNSQTGDYLVRLSGFNFVIAFAGGIAMLVLLAMVMLGLVKRLFDLVFLFLALPFVTATIPMDDGARFRKWRETVISKVLLAWGAVFSMNVFLLMIPVIWGLPFGGLLATPMKLFLLVGGGFAALGGQLLVARLFGTSADESREMMQGVRGMGAIAMGGVGVIKGAIIGGKVGAAAGGLNLGKTIANQTAGGGMTGGGSGGAGGGGQAYTGQGGSKQVGGSQKLHDSLRGSGMGGKTGATGAAGATGASAAAKAHPKAAIASEVTKHLKG